MLVINDIEGYIFTVVITFLKYIYYNSVLTVCINAKGMDSSLQKIIYRIFKIILNI